MYFERCSRSDVAFGSLASILLGPSFVRLTPISYKTAVIERGRRLVRPGTNIKMVRCRPMVLI
jgi:hypothetical protein